MIYTVIRFALQHRVALSILALLITLGSWTWYIDSRACKRCTEATVAKYERLMFEAHQKHLFELSKMDGKYDSTSKAISKIPAGCVSDGDRYFNQWMRDNLITGQ